jgi:hypothetical protein
VPDSKLWTAKDAIAFQLLTNPIVIDLMCSIASFYKSIIKPFRSKLHSISVNSVQTYNELVASTFKTLEDKDTPTLAILWQFHFSKTGSQYIPLQVLRQYTNQSLSILDPLPDSTLIEDTFVQNLTVMPENMSTESVDATENYDLNIDLSTLNLRQEIQHNDKFNRQRLNTLINGLVRTIYQFDKVILYNTNNTYMPMTNNAIESEFSLFKDILWKNLNTRVEISDALLKIHACPIDFAKIYYVFTQYDLINQARRRLDNAHTQRQYQQMEAEQAAKAIVKKT